MERNSPRGIKIRRGQAGDLIKYLSVYQRSAAKVYETEAGGAHDLFGPKHFFHDSLMQYWREMTANDGENHWWVAERANDSEIVGGICLREHADHFEGRGFYVDPDWQGQGIGKKLLKERDKLITKPLLFEVFSYSKPTIGYHLRHGAELTGHQRQIHWDSWPNGVTLSTLEFIKR